MSVPYIIPVKRKSRRNAMNYFCNSVRHYIKFITTSFIPEPGWFSGAVFMRFKVIVYRPVYNCCTYTLFEVKLIETSFICFIILRNNCVEFFDYEIFTFCNNIRLLFHRCQVHTQLFLRNKLFFRVLRAETFSVCFTFKFELFLFVSFP